MKLKFSKDFQLLLERISKNKVAKKLLSLKDSDKAFNYNYIGIGDTNNLVSFTPSDKVDKALNELPRIYTVNEIRNLRHVDSNSSIFERLGYNQHANPYWYPNNETDEYGNPYHKGRILGETKSKVSDNIYVLYQCISSSRFSVINKEALVEIESSDNEIYLLNRNTLRVGRLVTHFLTVDNFDFCEKDIEVFVNLYKSSYDFSKNGDKQFKIVSGDDIKKWYRNSNYVGFGIENGNRGVLNNSCMGDKDPTFFDIYSNNSACSMLILYSDNGVLNSDGSYYSDKIKGRCLLWDAELNGVKIKMLDRIYTNYDSDIDLFKNYAISRGWYFKEGQSMDPYERISKDGSEWLYTDTDDTFLKVELNHRIYKNYPYMDTFCYWVEEDNKVFLINQRNNTITREFRTTGGQYSIYFEDSHTGYGPTDRDFAEYNEYFLTTVSPNNITCEVRSNSSDIQINDGENVTENIQDNFAFAQTTGRDTRRNRRRRPVPDISTAPFAPITAISADIQRSDIQSIGRVDRNSTDSDQVTDRVYDCESSVPDGYNAQIVRDEEVPVRDVWEDCLVDPPQSGIGRLRNLFNW